MDENPGDILARLEELRKYQDEQQQKLLQKQIAQREQLKKEQANLYGKLGFVSKNENDIEDMPAFSDSDESEHEYEGTNNEVLQTVVRDDSEEEASEIDSEQEDHELDESILIEFSKNRQNEDLYKVDPTKKQVPKKPFLKRGEGLKSRFKVDPNAFKLDNLPKYKFANLHKERMAKKNNKIQEKKTIEDKQTIQTQNSKLSKKKSNEVKKKAKGKLVLDLDAARSKKLVISNKPVVENKAEDPLNEWIKSNVNRSEPESTGECF